MRSNEILWFDMDIYDEKKRSEIMGYIRNSNTKPEILVRKTIHALGYRFRLHRKDLPGKPDIVLPKHKSVVFVHGCFWHHHRGCKKSALPKSNVVFWKQKIMANVKRDQRSIADLRKLGWKIIIVWECEINSQNLSAKLKTALEENNA